MKYFDAMVFVCALLMSAAPASADTTPIMDGRSDLQLQDLDEALRSLLPINGAVISLAGRLSPSHTLLVLDLNALTCERTNGPRHRLTAAELVRATDLAMTAMDQPVPYRLDQITADAIHRVALRKSNRVVLVAPPGPLIAGAAADLITLCLAATRESR